MSTGYVLYTGLNSTPNHKNGRSHLLPNIHLLLITRKSLLIDKLVDEYSILLAKCTLVSDNKKEKAEKAVLTNKLFQI